MASSAFPFVCPSATHPLTTKKIHHTNIRCPDLIVGYAPRFVFFAHIAAVETRDFKLFHCPHLAAIYEGKGCDTCPKTYRHPVAVCPYVSLYHSVHSNGFPHSLPFPIFPVTTAASPLHRAVHSASRRPPRCPTRLRLRVPMTLCDFSQTASVQIAPL